MVLVWQEKGGVSHSLAAALMQPAFLEKPLEQQGLDGLLSFQRQISTPAPGPGVGAEAAHSEPQLAPLDFDDTAEVDDENKERFVRRWLFHRLVASIQQQAIAFREGVCEVVPPYLLGLLDAAELKRTWGGFELDDDQLCTLRQHTFVAHEAAALAKLLWLWLEAIEPALCCRLTVQGGCSHPRFSPDGACGSRVSSEWP